METTQMTRKQWRKAIISSTGMDPEIYVKASMRLFKQGHHAEAQRVAGLIRELEQQAGVPVLAAVA